MTFDYIDNFGVKQTVVWTEPKKLTKEEESMCHLVLTTKGYTVPPEFCEKNTDDPFPCTCCRQCCGCGG